MTAIFLNGIPKDNTSKIHPKPRAPSYANQKSEISTHDIHVSQLHLVHQTQYFIEWAGYRPFKLQIKILQGSEKDQNPLTAMEIGFCAPHTYMYIEKHKKAKFRNFDINIEFVKVNLESSV